MKWLLFALMALVLAAPCYGQSPKDDLKAKHEILRRGNFVEQTGTIRSGLMAAALAPPADDSDKWFVTLVYKAGDADSEALKKTIETDPDVRHWIDVGNPDTSKTHYQPRLITDKTQEHWLEGLKEKIEKDGLPAIVLQPPRNGRFGDPSRVVKLLHGKMSGKVLADRLHDAVVDYITEIDKGGVTQEPIGVAPPFNVTPPPPTNPVSPDALPVEWPQSKPKALTIRQIRDACPGCPPEFVEEILDQKLTDPERLELKWMLYQQKHPAEPKRLEPEPAEEIVPARPFPQESTKDPLLALIVLGAIAAAFGGGWLMSRRIPSAGPNGTGGMTTNPFATTQTIGQDGRVTIVTTDPAMSAPAAATNPAPTWRPNGSNVTSSGTNG